MRKILLLIFICVIASEAKQSFAQTNVYHPFPDSGAAWNTGLSYLSGNTGVQCEQWDWIQGDTLINNMTYHKLYRYKTCSGGGPPVLMLNGYVGGIRQEVSQRRVYFYSPSFSSEKLLYDFNLVTGDTVKTFIASMQGNRVVLVDSILLDNSYRKRFWLSPLGGQSGPLDSAYAALIEGIGSTTGLTEYIYVPFESGSWLNCFWQNGTKVYGNLWTLCSFTTGLVEDEGYKEGIVISPNPSTGIFTFNFTEQFQFSVHDIFGREVYQSFGHPISQSTTLDLSSYPKGIYFVKLKINEGIVSRKIILQ